MAGSVQVESTKHSALMHMLLLVGGTGFSQVLTAVSAPLLTRVYSPHDFGVYAVALAIFNLLVAAVCLRYELAIVLPRTQRSAVNVMALCVAVTSFMTVAAIAICFASWAAQFVGNRVGLEWWAALLIPLGVLFYGFQQIIRLWCIRNQEFSLITTMVMVQTFVTIGIQVVAGVFLSGNPAYLMLGTVLGTVVMVAVAVPYMIKTLPLSLLSAIRLSRVLKVAKRHRRFPIFSSPYCFLAQAVGRLVLLILSVFVSTATIGEFALAQRVVYLPVSVLTTSMGQVFYSRAAHHLDDPKLQRFVLRIMVAGGLVFVPLVAFNFGFSEQIFQLVFGARWAEAGRFAAYLGIASGFVTLTAWLDRVYDIHSCQRLSLIQEAIADTVSLSILALAIYLSRDAVVGIASYAFSVVGYYLVWTYVTFRIARFPMKFYGNIMGSIAAAGAFAIVSGVLVAFLTSNQLLQAVLFSALNAPVLVAGLRIGRNGLKQRGTAFAFLKV